MENESRRYGRDWSGAWHTFHGRSIPCRSARDSLQRIDRSKACRGDRLATAVITKANKKSWPEFVKIYNKTVEATRSGRVDAMNASVVITSLGAFGVKAGAPIVVPPSVGTLFVGTAHRELIPNKNENESAEVITLSLTFDHRVVNGAGAANFVHDVKQLIEKFTIPSKERPGTCAHKS